MMDMHADWEGWFMTAPGAPFERRGARTTTASPGEAVVEVAGCGVCHTDLSFLLHGVKTRSALPLVLGHEIVRGVRPVQIGTARHLPSADHAGKRS
jgi:6-hydroxycyclohex-1-ene-1-carbonyl-CoA dehydrogenase